MSGRKRTPALSAAGRGTRRARILLVLLMLSTFFPPAALAQQGAENAPVELGESPILSVGPLAYHPGRGLRAGSTGLVVGGFINVKAEDTDEAGGEFSLDKLDFFFIFDRYARFRAVADLQLKDIFVADDEQVGTGDFAFDVRRLFGDFTASDQFRIRAGTFLTPVGYWNLILAPPLTWTTENPLIAEETFFQQTTTGVMLSGSVASHRGRFGYALFSQFLDPLEDDPDLMPPEHTAGARLTYDHGPKLSLGLSYQAAELGKDGLNGTSNNGSDEEDPEAEEGDPEGWTHLVGAHFLSQYERGEVLGEVYFQDGEGLKSSQWGTYLQGVFEVYHPFYLVGRYEHFDPPSGEVALNVFTFGGVWKPFPFMAVKVEYRFADRNPDEDDPQGFFSSFTTFF